MILPEEIGSNEPRDVAMALYNSHQLWLERAGRAFVEIMYREVVREVAFFPLEEEL